MKKYFENKGTTTMYVAGVMILPGDGAMVDVPPEPVGQAAPKQATLAEQVALLLQGTVKFITASLDNLSDDTLDMMRSLEEQAANPRTTLLTAIDAEGLRRADATLAKLAAKNGAADGLQDGSDDGSGDGDAAKNDQAQAGQ